MNSHTSSNGFTLIELVVVILITSILISMSVSFFNWVQLDWEKRKLLSESLVISELLWNIQQFSLYFPDYHDSDLYEVFNSKDVYSATDLYYILPSISPVLIDSSKINEDEMIVSDINSISDFSTIVLWLKQCNFFISYDLGSISWKPYLSDCNIVYNSFGILSLQWFILSNQDDVLFQITDQAYNTDDYYGFRLDGYTELSQIIYNNILDEEVSNSYVYFDLLSSTPQDFIDSHFQLVKFPDYTWSEQTAFFVWTESELLDEFINTYIPGQVKWLTLDTFDLSHDRYLKENFMNESFSNIDFIYNYTNIPFSSSDYLFKAWL